MIKDEIIEKIIEKLKNIDKEIVYIFGSYAKCENTKDSDVDIAFYSRNEYDSFEIFLLAQEISTEIKKEVDLVQLKNSSTVFQKEVVENGIYIYEKSSTQREKFELLVYKKYFKLNEERKEIIDNYEV